MNNINLRNLDEREINFIDRLNKRGKFEYVGGYDTIKGNVRVIHKKCGCETTMRAYAVAYNDIDKCKECGRQVRAYDKCKRQIEELNPDIEVLRREKDISGKNRYIVQCRDCGSIYNLAYDILKEGGFKCCLDGVGGYERASEYKAKEIYHKLRKERKIPSREDLMDLILEEVREDAYLKLNKGLVDDWKLVSIVADYIEDRIERDKVGYCSCCGEWKVGSADWGRGDKNFKSKVCVKCAKVSKKCAMCGKEKRLNTYASDENGYLDICYSCNTKLKKKEQAKLEKEQGKK